MDQRRFLAFLLTSVAIVFLFNTFLFPPQRKPPAPPQKPAAPAQPDVAQDDDGKGPAEQPAAVKPVDPSTQLADLNAPTRFVTLGSLDPETGYRMLVTLSSKGASIHRAEMSSPRLADQHDRSGYLGELELSKVDDGWKVEVVGRGTPADKAGLSAGDIIVALRTSADDEPKSKEDVLKAISKPKPGQELELQVKRGEQDPTWRTVTLTRRPFAVLRPEIENYQMRDEDPPAGFVDRPSLLLTLKALGDKRLAGPEIDQVSAKLEKGEAISDQERALLEYSKRVSVALEDANWQIAGQDANSVTFTRPLPELKLELIKRYMLRPSPPEKIDDENDPSYHLQLDVEVRNTSDDPLVVAYRLDGPTGMPTEGWWYANKISQQWGASGLRDVSVRFEGGRGVQYAGPMVAQGKVETMTGRPLLYGGVDGQYFSAILIPVKPTSDDWFDSTDAIFLGAKPDKRTNLRNVNVTTRMARKPMSIAPGGSHKDSYQVFIGPKRPALFENYHIGGDPNYTLDDVIYYGWFGGIARAMLAILHFFYSIVRNYGLAIIMLTVLVRGAMFPLSIRQTQNMARMQALKPEMDRIAEKYKSDMQKRSQATQELYRKHKINPLGGCLPMLLQLPIFVGLYRALMVDVELRGSPLFGPGIRWCSNLAAPDMLLDWSAVMPDFITHGTGLFSLGLYLNILPIITVSLFLVTQKMTMPPPTNEQGEMQQKMMKYMTMFMCVLFYKVASGLCLYFIASSLWGIAERQFLKRFKNDGGTLATATTEGTGSPDKPNGSRTPKPGRNGSGDKKKRSKPRKK